MLTDWLYVPGYGVYFITASGSTSTFPWRFPLAFQGFPALLLLIGSKLLPFSPRWLMTKGRHDEAHEVLKRLHARKQRANSTHTTSQDAIHAQADIEFHQLRKQVELDQQLASTTSTPILDLFKTPANRKRCLIAIVMMAGNMFTGVLLIANYAVLIFTNLGLSGSTPLLLLSIWVSISLFGNTFTALFIDKWGRRPFMLVGIGGILVSLICECALQAIYVDSTTALTTPNKPGQRAAVFFIYLFIVFWSSCMDASQFLYLSEIFPTHLRPQGTAVGMCAWYTAQIIILVAGPIGLTNVGWRFLLVLIVPTACYWGVVYTWFPETRMRSLEEVQGCFGERVAVRCFGGVGDVDGVAGSSETGSEGKNESGPTNVPVQVSVAVDPKV